MSGKLDSIMRPLGQRLIADFGAPVILTRTVKTFVPATGLTTSVDTDFTVDMSPPSPYDQKRIDGTLIQEGDAWAIISALSPAGTIDPTTDSVAFAGYTWNIVRMKPIYSGVLPAVYEVQLRR